MSNVFFTSDLHLGHRLAAEMRGFSSVAKHDDAVIESLQLLKKRDVLWVMGDVAMSHEGLLRFGAEVGCTKNLIFGNHDQFPLEEYAREFTNLHGFRRYKQMWLSHCPIHPQEMYRCRANIHGHIHKGGDSPVLPFPYINVNWDFWQRPLPLEEILHMIALGEEERDAERATLADDLAGMWGREEQ